jgi:hypothetical protein
MDLLQIVNTWLQRIQESTSNLEWDLLWKLHLQGVSFRQVIFKRLVSGEFDEHLNQINLLLLQGEQNLRGVFLQLDPAQINQDVLQHYINKCSECLDDLNRDTTIQDNEEVRLLLCMVHEMRFLKRLSAHHLSLKESYQEDLINEIYGLGSTEWYKEALSHANLLDTFNDLHEQGLEREVNFLEHCLSSLDTTKSLWRTLLWSSELEIKVGRSSCDESFALVKRCQQARQIIYSNILDIWNQSTQSTQGDQSDQSTQSDQEKSNESQSFYIELESYTWSLYHHSSDLLSQIDHNELEHSILSLECINETLTWFFNYLKALTINKKDHKKLYIAIQKLRKQYQLTKAELQERHLQNRLENIFGHRFVAWFERLIFALIFLVLGLLVFELIWVDEHEILMRNRLALIDTGICFIFLLEFFTKLFLSNNRSFYFKRRWFIDFLPSIPFVLVTDYFLLDHLVSGRAAKLARLSRLVRYIRIARPFIRMIRLISFTLRGLDRLVRRYALWLNQNLIFFEPQQDIHRRPEQNLFQHCEQVYALSLHHCRVSCSQLSSTRLSRILPIYLNSLEKHLDWENAPLRIPILDEDSKIESKRDIPVEQAIHTLLHLQGAQLEAHLGSDFPKHIYFILGIFDFPIIRNIPILKSILDKRRRSTPSELSAWVVRGFGRFLEILMSMGYFFADLYGIITGPKLIDRVGSTLVRSFERPAKRLLIIGFIFVMAHVMVSTLDIPFFSPVLSFLQKFIGLPVIVIGSICLIPLITGMWMKNIAGQATELYRLTSEAQFINLLKDLKNTRTTQDLTLLYQRILQPETLIDLTPDQAKAIDKDAAALSFAQRLYNKLNQPINFKQENDAIIQAQIDSTSDNKNIEEHIHHIQDGDSLQRQSAANDEWWLEYKITMLYRDYLDGALLHQSDVKTTEQLLGNLALRNLLYYKLNLSKKEIKDLEKLDLGAHRSILGPFMWFSLITQSISQSTAQLLLDYNRFIIPQNAVMRRDPVSLSLYQQWKATKGIGSLKENISLDTLRPDLPLYQNTEFSSLHLLINVEDHEQMICSRFGEDVFKVLQQDQQLLIRGIFSSYPLHQLPKGLRTLNPYQLYQEYLFGGRIFALPFRLIGLIFKGIILAMKWMKAKIDEIRFPEITAEPIIAQKDFVVAKRKIDRMRKSIYMKIMQLRARVDFEYLGLTLDGIPVLSPLDHPPLFDQDLAYIQAIEQERDYFVDLQERRHSQLKELKKLLITEGLFADDLKQYIKAKYPSLIGRESEVLRALAIAYTTDFKKIQSYLQTKEKMDELFKDSLNGQPNRSFRLHKNMMISASRSTQRLINLGKDKEKAGFLHFWKVLGYKDRLPHEESLCWKRYLAEGRELRPLLCEFAQKTPVDWRQVLDEVICYCNAWSDELVTLRSIQTLSIMDVQNYRNYIWNLGGYKQDNEFEDEDDINIKIL